MSPGDSSLRTGSIWLDFVTGENVLDSQKCFITFHILESCLMVLVCCTASLTSDCEIPLPVARHHNLCLGQEIWKIDRNRRGLAFYPLSSTRLMNSIMHENYCVLIGTASMRRFYNVHHNLCLGHEIWKIDKNRRGLVFYHFSTTCLINSIIHENLRTRLNSLDEAILTCTIIYVWRRNMENR